ncbi:ImmA/IrrE family metallo-endopeptidase [Desulfosporosinus sp. HMP52]|uniref:ImmA/IrrE family metallo-endopeptidase n=1 Tax=Desulfosporosinus sp. HMP52 TaxID=1487923 RepID=UPI00068F1BCF|nr:ImmA/IrrE family metallo-endopeptidase [Desulfosporosinus sp. HMP52]
MYDEEIARKRARRFFQVKNLSLPVDIEKIVKEYADIEEDYIPYDGDAICINREGRPLIILRKNVSENRKRFTLAHELGHIQIPYHTGMLSCHTNDGVRIDSSKYYQMEREADTFAAELLMPQSWLRELVNMKTNIIDMKRLINIICEQAQVSFSAAVYNLINVLPKGFIIYLENKIEDYYQRKSGDTLQPVFLKDDLEWVSFNSLQNGFIEHEILNVYWFFYKDILDEEVIDSCIRKYLEKYKLSKVLNEIINMQNYSIAFSLRLLLDKLPSGYIMKILFKPTETYDYLTSLETYVYPPRLENLDNWYNEYCQDSGKYEDKNLQIKWWYFKTSFDLKLNIEDKRDSRTILKNIIDNWHLEIESKRRVYGIVNGIIGSLNNNRNKFEREQFYSILKQKFLGIEELIFVIEHRDFNQYLVKKTLELYEK